MKLLIHGHDGKMAQQLCHYAQSVQTGLTLLGTVGRGGKPASASGPQGVSRWGYDEAPWAQADTIIDFTLPDGLMPLLPYCIKNGVALVSGTTGLNAKQQQEVEQAARKIAIVQSFNMSLGVTLLSVLVEQASRALGDDFDIEINELHHRHKKDSPSGTALLLGRAAAAGRGVSLEQKKVTERNGERKAGDIGFSVMRGGGVIGDHTVMLAGENERLEFTHRGHNRSIYAEGAFKAAHWVQEKPAGLYSMRDVLMVNG